MAELVAPVVPTAGSLTKQWPMGFEAVSPTGGLLHQRKESSRKHALGLGLAKLESSGVLDNFRRAGGRADLVARGPKFADSDAYKWLEAVSWEGQACGEELLGQAREVVELIAGAQAADGYLDTMTAEPYQDLLWSHEHYVAGHLIQAAVADARMGTRLGLEPIANALIGHLTQTFGEAKHRGLDGHPQLEMALVEWYRLTGNNAALELATWMVNSRGRGTLTFHEFESSYFCDRVPLRELTSPEGHAVRALYLAAGATDVAVETQDKELLNALVNQFAQLCSSKMYLTGGVGSRWEQESLGDPFELPTERAYCETCAAIATMHWAWRLLLATGEVQYADVFERVLYNAFMSGFSEEVDRFLYVNPLQIRADAVAHDGRSAMHGRREWFDCACCPPNVMRMLASLAGYLVTETEDTCTLWQLMPAQISTADAEIYVETSFPKASSLAIRVAGAAPGWRLRVRLPAGATAVSVTGPGARIVGRFAEFGGRWRVEESITITWNDPPRLVFPDPRIDSVRGCAAVQCGPLVYAFEEHDNHDLESLAIDPEMPRLVKMKDNVRLNGKRYQTVSAEWPYTFSPVEWPSANSGQLFGIPYYQWGKRGVVPMKVWLPLA